MRILIRKLGTLIDVSPDGRSPLPAEVLDQLKPHLYYVHTRTLHGAEQWLHSSDGGRQYAVSEPRDMYRLEEGRLTTGYGFLPKITNTLRRHDHEVYFLDLTPPKPDRTYEPDWDSLWRDFEPRPRQRECLEAIAASPGGIISAAPGFGKTTLFGAVCRLYPRARIAVVVEPKDVAQGIVRDLTRQFPNVGQVGGGVRRHGDRITVYTAASMHHARGDEDILLADEVGGLMAASHSRKLGAHFRYTRNFGFSGSIGARADGADAMLEMFFGPTIFELPYQEAVGLGLVTQIHVDWLMIDDACGNPARNKHGTAKMRWGIWRNDYRNAAFADHAKRVPPPGEQILMAVATFEHAVKLWQFLPDFELCYAGKEAEEIEGYVRSRLLPPNFQMMTAARRQGLRQAFETGELRRVIATDVWSTGVDFTQLAWLYRLDARSSQEKSIQWPCRTSRVDADKAAAHLVDAVDAFDAGLLRKSKERRRHYRAQGWSEDWPAGRRQASNV